MVPSKGFAMASSSPSPSEGQLVPPSEVESQLSSLVVDLSQQVQVAMESMLKMINEIDENSTGIMEEIVNCKVNALNRKKTLGEQKENFQKLHSLFWTCSTTRILHEVVISSTIFLCQALLIRYKTFMRL